jgi:hypothetical protein
MSLGKEYEGEAENNRLIKRDGVSVAFWEGAFDTRAHRETNLPVQY